MKALLILLAIAASVSHSKYERPVETAGAQQNYIVVDEAIWKHARPDLGDLRLVTGDAEVPYALIVERSNLEENRTELRVLQQAKVDGKTQFLIDMSALTEYNHVELKLAAKDFVAHALVYGQDDLHGPKWALLGDSILYDLSSERLGSNTVLRLPRATYRYLRVIIDGPVTPKDVRGAASETAQEHADAWRDVSSSPSKEQKEKDTIFTFHASDRVPVERVTFTPGDTTSNFRREVEIRNGKDGWLGSGQIERVHLVRNGRKIDSENYSVSFTGGFQNTNDGEDTIKVVIHNGDDRPLDIAAARLQQLERRVYFAAPAQGKAELYYGDEKLPAPIYDYAKLFQQEKAAVAANLGVETPNAAYVPRPDDRPWTERHPEVLWIAIVVAVLVLGAVALRSLRIQAA